ncbi:MAG: hypothetical protein WC617_03060 [Rhodanobacter sp.]
MNGGPVLGWLHSTRPSAAGRPAPARMTVLSTSPVLKYVGVLTIGRTVNAGSVAWVVPDRLARSKFQPVSVAADAVT